MEFELHPEALEELRSAAAWYERQRPGLGRALVAEAREVRHKISLFPRSYPVWPGTENSVVPIRRAPLRGFPYVVAYEIHEAFVLVLAFAHAKRRPLYWRHRSR